MENNNVSLNSSFEDIDWKAMYLHLAAAVEDAVRILIKAQQECEEMYIGGE